MYTAFTPNTAHTEYRFRTIGALVRRLGGTTYRVEHDSAVNPGPHRTVMILHRARRDTAYNVIMRLRVPVEALTDDTDQED